jgi:hypothetical protein
MKEKMYLQHFLVEDKGFIYFIPIPIIPVAYCLISLASFLLLLVTGVAIFT